MIDYEVKNKAIDQLIADIGLSIQDTFVPWSMSRNSKEKMPSLNWKITLLYKDKPIISGLDYTAGYGYCPGSNSSDFPSSRSAYYHSILQRERIEAECKTGKKCRGEHNTPTNQSIEPEARDVIHSLLSDSIALDNSFEDWCAEFGSDPDSIKNKAVYDACIQIGIALRKIGEANLQKLKDAFQDY